MLLVDNCILQSLGSARFLHLLKSFRDLRTSREVSVEQERTAPPHCQAAFKQAVKEGWIRVEPVPPAALQDQSFPRVRAFLGTTDAGLLCWAKTSKAVLITDDTNLYEMAVREGVQCIDLTDVLQDLTQMGLLNKDQLRKVVFAVEYENGRKFKPADLEQLGLK